MDEHGGARTAHTGSFHQRAQLFDANLEEIAPHLGEFLVSKGYINQAQLQQGLEIQEKSPGSKSLIGQILIEMGFLSLPGARKSHC